MKPTVIAFRLAFLTALLLMRLELPAA